MTSKLTIEQAKRLRNDFECWQQDYDPKDDKEQYDMFGRGMVAMDMLIAGMYQEPVAYTDERNLGYIDRGRETAYLWGKQNSEASDVALYRHAQPAPEHPEVLPCSVLLEPGLRFSKGIKTSTMLAALARRAVHESDMAALSPEERAEFQAGIEDFKSLIAQQPVVPDEKPMPNSLSMYAVDAVAAIAEVKGWNACRAAMLQEPQKSAGTEAICRSDENVQVLHTKSPAQSDCCPAQNHVSPEQNSVAPAQSPIDHGYRPECECSGCKATARICAELSANSSANPDCWCRTCRPVTLNDMRFVVCPDCGNKRCPRANDHRNSCTGSNEPGQEGSAYPDTTQEPKP